ncbi:MAG: Fe-S protein assembly co-chaperone HscB [Candidatus Jidaibacter sp.]|jgi:molecular chaperone HscB|nr:Fe-S protein assembly co-chaperone HscB [Candidatus Jidaibacter sp.]
MNYFELFGLPEEVDLNHLNLQKAYFSLQKSMHPDKFTNASSVEREAATESAAVINKAYKILSNKFKRAEYLIGLHTSLEVQLPDDFMEQTFSWHEKLLDGEDLSTTLNALEESLWDELRVQAQSCAWAPSAICLAKIRMVNNISGNQL